MNYDDSEIESSDDDLEALEDMILPRGRGKYKDKLPIIFFHVIKLVILMQGVLTEMTRMKGKTTSSKEKEMEKTLKDTIIQREG